MMTSTSPTSYLLSESGLRVERLSVYHLYNKVPNTSSFLNNGHLSVYHLYNKVPNISSFLSNGHPCIHLLGVNESCLDYRLSDESMAIPRYFTFRRDAITQGETGLVIYVHAAVHNIIRRADLESQSVESFWLENSRSKSTSLLVGFVYRNPAATYPWHDEFLVMLDKVADSKKKILLLGDLNIDLSKSHLAWESTYSLVGLHQLVTKSTRMTCTTDTLIDNLYTNSQDPVHNASVPDIGISDLYSILYTWSTNLPRCVPKGHTII